MQRTQRYDLIDAGASGPAVDVQRRLRTCADHLAEPQIPRVSSAEEIDRAVRAGIAHVTAGLAPSALAGAFFDWAVHLAASPGKQLDADTIR